MKILVARRGEGKTSGCVAYLRQHPRAYLVVGSNREVARVRQQYTLNEHEVSKRIVSYDMVMEPGWYVLTRPSGLVIDNADMILGRIFEVPVEALAVTWPDEVRR